MTFKVTLVNTDSMLLFSPITFNFWRSLLTMCHCATDHRKHQQTPMPVGPMPQSQLQVVSLDQVSQARIGVRAGALVATPRGAAVPPHFAAPSASGMLRERMAHGWRRVGEWSVRVGLLKVWKGLGRPVLPGQAAPGATVCDATAMLLSRMEEVCQMEKGFRC